MRGPEDEDIKSVQRKMRDYPDTKKTVNEVLEEAKIAAKAAYDETEDGPVTGTQCKISATLDGEEKNFRCGAQERREDENGVRMVMIRKKEWERRKAAARVIANKLWKKEVLDFSECEALLEMNGYRVVGTIPIVIRRYATVEDAQGGSVNGTAVEPSEESLQRATGSQGSPDYVYAVCIELREMGTIEKGCFGYMEADLRKPTVGTGYTWLKESREFICRDDCLDRIEDLSTEEDMPRLNNRTELDMYSTTATFEEECAEAAENARHSLATLDDDDVEDLMNSLGVEDAET